MGQQIVGIDSEGLKKGEAIRLPLFDTQFRANASR